jgi:hypothetical protein
VGGVGVGGLRWPVHRADKLVTFMSQFCDNSENLKFLELSGPIYVCTGKALPLPCLT